MYTDAFAICFTMFFSMELSAILNTEDPVHMLTLHLVYIPRINRALSELMEAFNHHAVPHREKLDTISDVGKWDDAC